MSTYVDYLRVETQDAAVLDVANAAYLAGYEKACADLVPRWSTDMDAAKAHDGPALFAWGDGAIAHAGGDLTGYLQRRGKDQPTHWMPLPPAPDKEE